MNQQLNKAEDCAPFLQALLNCSKEKKISRFFGGCEDEERAHIKCNMREHYRKRDESIEKSKGFNRGTQSLEGK